MDDETALETEQDTLDDHEDGVAQLTGRMEKLLATCSGSDSGVYKIVSNMSMMVLLLSLTPSPTRLVMMQCVCFNNTKNN